MIPRILLEGSRPENPQAAKSIESFSKSNVDFSHFRWCQRWGSINLKISHWCRFDHFSLEICMVEDFKLISIPMDEGNWHQHVKLQKLMGANLKIFKYQKFHRPESLKFTVARHVGISKYLVFKRDHVSQETPPGLILTRWLNSTVHCQISWPKLHGFMFHAKLSCRSAFQIVGDWHIWPHTECGWCPLSFICLEKLKKN